MYDKNSTTELQQVQHLLANPQLLQDLYLVTEEYQRSLDLWVDYRKNVIGEFNLIYVQLNKYKKNCFITTATSSSIGLASCVVAVSIPPLAVGAAILGVAASTVSFVGQQLKRNIRDDKLKNYQTYIETDKKMLEVVRQHNTNLSELITRIFNNEGFQQELKNTTDFESITMSCGEAAVAASRLADIVMIGLRKAAILKEPLDYALYTVTGVAGAVNAILLGKSLWDLNTDSKLAEEVKRVTEIMEKGLRRVLECQQLPKNN